MRAYRPDPAAGEGVTWVGHRWTRLWSSFAVLEAMMEKAARGYTWPRTGEPTYEELIERGGAGTDRRMTSAQQKVALEFGSEVQRLADPYELGGDSLAGAAPAPAPEGRIAPRD